MMTVYMRRFVFALCVCMCAAFVRSEDVVINTRYGALSGTRVSTGQESHAPWAHVDVFYNIPYAKPPVGPLRFAKPVTSDGWTGTREAGKPGPMCTQFPTWIDASNDTDVIGQEDCLYLNVYKPETPPGYSGGLPVMVWVHGGGYLVGRATQYDGRWLARKGVVVVTINYRLAAFGFLSTEDGEIVGNYGLWDQIQALKWVKAAISAFNGDPNDVTIFGESAGSSSVSLLTLSREAAGLFTKAIMQSGPSLFGYSHPGQIPAPKDTAAKLAKNVGCDASSSTTIKECLITKTADQIIKGSGKLQTANYLQFMPVIEWAFGHLGLFAGTPEVILQNAWFNNVTVIRGFNRDELMAVIAGYDPENDGISFETFKNVSKALAIPVHGQYPLVSADSIADMIVETYVTTPGLTKPTDLRHAAGLAYTDYMFIAPTFKEQWMWREAGGATEYCYCVTYRSAHKKGPIWQGVAHSDEIPYVFGETNNPNGIWHNFQQNGSWTEDDKRFADVMMTMWTDFAKHGNPTPAGSRYPEWTPSTAAATNFLDVKLVPEMEEVPAARARQLNLWNNVIPNLNQALAAAVVG